MRLLPIVFLIVAAVIGIITITGDGDGIGAAEEVNAGTAPFLPDSDFDRLNDSAEMELETSPTNPDTDGDGLPDGAEASDSGPVSAGDPLHHDVFVEVDMMTVDGETATISDEEIRNVEKALAESPLENPDGTTGVDLHVVKDETIQREEAGVINNEYWQIRQEHHDMQGSGYYYVVITEDVRKSASEDGLTGYAWSGAGGFVEDYPGNGDTFMHELGHSFGLLPNDYKGIDSKDVDPTEYRSIMNYNYPCDGCDPYRFSSSESTFNDWAFIQRNYDAPATKNLDNPLAELY